MTGIDPVSMAVVLALLALVPLVAVMTTSFLKIAVVLMLVRNALGVQQAPPNMAVYGLALILTVYVMGPVVMRIGDEVRSAAPSTLAIPDSARSSSPNRMPPADGAAAPADRGGAGLENLFSAVERGIEPLRDFMYRHSRANQREFFVRTAATLWGPELARGLAETDLIVLTPAFLVSQLTAAFEIGFLLYLPFVIIDLIVSNILLAMGMMMVSPVTISMPLKLFLFVMVDGWTRLIQGLVLSYA